MGDVLRKWNHGEKITSVGRCVDEGEGEACVDGGPVRDNFSLEMGG